MLTSYLKLAFRHLQRNGRYVFINVVGLALALAFSIFSFENYQFAHSFDARHPGKERIFRVESFKASNHLLHGVCPATLPPQALAEIPAVEAATRIDSRGLVVKRGENVFNQQVHFVDENFFAVFAFPLQSGQARLYDRDALLITEDLAKKFFGNEDPVGQTLLFYADLSQRKSLTISGVLKNCPKNSSLQFQLLTHLDNQLEGDQPVRYDSWKWMVDAAFLKLKSAEDAPIVEAALQQYVAPQNLANPDWQAERYRLENLRTLALNANDIRWNNLTPGTPPAAIWSNIVCALMLLLTACLNFANTTIAIGNRRLKEMGVRKVMGGSLRQLRVQLLGEAFVVCAAALALGMLLVFPLVKSFNSMWEHLDVKITYFDNLPMLGFLIGTVVLTTLLAGAYPAFYLTAFNPASIFRGAFRFGGSSLFSRIMMGMQVAMALAAVIVGFSFARNAQEQRQADLGYVREGILGTQTQDMAALRTFETAIRQNPKVLETAKTRHHVGFSFRRAEFSWQGQKQETLWFEVGKDYLPFMGMQLRSGRDFSGVNEAVGSQTEVLVNETFVREIGGGEVVGEMLHFDTITYRIAGVVKDFMTDSPFDPMSPLVIRCAPDSLFTYCIVKTRPEDLQAVHADMESTWKQLFPYKPFSSFYQSEVIAEALEVSENIATTMSLFSIVILLLTISGLFALVSLNALKQFRSLAVRRVLGAKTGEIAYQLNRNFLVITLLAVVLGCLGGRVFALSLLDGIYKIHTGVSLPVLLLSAAGVLLALTMTLGVKVWQVLRVNLTEALKVD